MHHFRNAALVEDNGKATNSPNYRYRLTEETLQLVRAFQTSEWQEFVSRFLKYHEKLVDIYASKKKMTMMPDVVLYSEDKNWIYVVESVTSVGPMDAKRILEIAEMTKNVVAGKIFVTAFPEEKMMRKMEILHLSVRLLMI